MNTHVVVLVVLVVLVVVIMVVVAGCVHGGRGAQAARAQAAASLGNMKLLERAAGECDAVRERAALVEKELAVERQLRAPADLRVIATSIQFGHSYNGWESWTLFPRERERMIELIRSTQADGVVFLSGDVHWGEISRQDVPGGYPLYDVTASGLNQDWDKIEPSARRVGQPSIDPPNRSARYRA